MVLRDLLGHSSVLVTEKYIRRLDTTRIYREAYERAGTAEGLVSRRAARIAGGGRRVRRRLRRGGDLMPATVIENPLGIFCVFSDGRTAEFRAGRVAVPGTGAGLAVRACRG